MLRSTCTKCGGDINALADEGKLRAVILTLPNGTEILCNSAWAATDYLKANEAVLNRSDASIRYA